MRSISANDWGADQQSLIMLYRTLFSLKYNTDTLSINVFLKSEVNLATRPYKLQLNQKICCYFKITLPRRLQLSTRNSGEYKYP